MLPSSFFPVPSTQRIDFKGEKYGRCFFKGGLDSLISYKKNKIS